MPSYITVSVKIIFWLKFIICGNLYWIICGMCVLPGWWFIFSHYIFFSVSAFIKKTNGNIISEEKKRFIKIFSFNKEKHKKNSNISSKVKLLFFPEFQYTKLTIVFLDFFFRRFLHLSTLIIILLKQKCDSLFSSDGYYYDVFGIKVRYAYMPFYIATRSVYKRSLLVLIYIFFHLC